MGFEHWVSCLSSAQRQSLEPLGFRLEPYMWRLVRRLRAGSEDDNLWWTDDMNETFIHLQQLRTWRDMDPSRFGHIYVSPTSHARSCPARPITRGIPRTHSGSLASSSVFPRWFTLLSSSSGRAEASCAAQRSAKTNSEMAFQSKRQACAS